MRDYFIFLGRIFGLDLDLFFDGRNLVWWNEMRYKVNTCLRDHQLFAACVAGEANTRLYHDDIYKYTHLLVDKFKIDPTKENPRLLLVAGPVINVSKRTGRSIAIELCREGLMDLYYSEYRQPIHYRIGGWGAKERTGKETPLRIIREKTHHPLAPAHLRKAEILNQDNIKDQPAIRDIEKGFRELIKSSVVQKITDGDMIKKFIFLTRDEHKSLNENIINFYKKNYGRKAEDLAFSIGNAPNLNRDFFLQRLEEINIQPRQYPGPMVKKNKSNGTHSQNRLCHATLA